MRPGGAAVNVALSLAKRKKRVGVAAVVGDDALGEALGARLARAGVVAMLDPALPRTPILLAERRDDGARVGYRSSDEPAPRVPPSEARAVLITGLMPSAEHARALSEAARAARARGATVFLDVTARPRVWRGRDPAAALAVMAECDVVKASDEDLRVLGIEALPAREGATTIVTAGARPARVRGSFGELTRAPPTLLLANRPVGDTLGAGDAFMAGLLGARLAAQGANDARSWGRAVEAGHAAALLLLGRRGSQPRRIAR
jgi:sugar/nucleoside kinase (ribokinase family)